MPVSAMPVDGTFPTGTAAYEKRNLALEIPVWETDLCTQCGKCVMVCPHSVIRSKIYSTDLLANAPETFKHAPMLGKDFPAGLAISYQVAPEDCTGCTLVRGYLPDSGQIQCQPQSYKYEASTPATRTRTRKLGFLFILA